MTATVVEAVPTLRENEHIIERGIATVFEVGAALMRIRDEQQFVDAGYEAFEEYVQQRWPFDWRQAYNYIGAAKVCSVLQAHNLPAPLSERAANPLVKVMNQAGGFDYGTKTLRDPKAAERAVVTTWKQVLAQHDAGPDSDNQRPITGRDVAKVVSPPVSAGKPNWGELLGRVGDELKNTEKHLAKVEKAIGEKDLTQKVRTNAGRYAEWADDIAARLRQIEEAA